MDFLIEKEKDGMSVLNFLRHDVGLSGAMLRHLKFISDGITVNSKHVTVRHILRAGEILSIKSEDSEPSGHIVPSDIKICIAYEDDDLVVPDKPPFMPTHPSHGHFDDTVANALCHRYGREGTPFVFRPVNRLDRNTSGLLIIARNRMAASKLTASMKRGEIQKEYIAVLDGFLPYDAGQKKTIDTFMKRTDESIIVRRVCSADEGGDRALTSYRVLFSNGTNTVVAATPVTGRTHQLRVHFAHIGAPIVGDDMYGKASEHIARHALHAAAISFPHPSSDEKIALCSPLPSDMAALLRALFGEDELKKIYSRIQEEIEIDE